MLAPFYTSGVDCGVDQRIGFMPSLYQECQEQGAASCILPLAFSTKACILRLLAIGCSRTINPFHEECYDCRKQIL
jgi:hypothetical protein